jgi:WD40 repeat protein/mono/diheme cytochrome c family protein
MRRNAHPTRGNDMKRTAVTAALLTFLLSTNSAPADPPPGLAARVREVLKANCYRCHGQDGAIEGGFNYVLDRDKLVASHKIISGKPDDSPLWRKVVAGKMPPPDQQPRPSAADIALLKQWIEAGAPGAVPAAPRTFITEDDVAAWMLADLDKVDRRARRFARYFSIVDLFNAGLTEDELQTYRNALAKLLNSLSWHPRVTLPQAIDANRLVLRIDLRDFLWDANLWNRILAEYPYGILPDSAAAKACLVATATKMPCIRADWFVATASRPPLYHDLLQLPTNLAELEAQLRVNAAVDIQQERVGRLGFNGSGIAKNNRILERHDAVHGAYWRTYDFEAVPQNLVDRGTLLPDRRNVFAYPLGPGSTDNLFLHAGGEVIFNLPNGLQGYMIVNANNQRLDKAATAIVSDAKRPDKAVENGVSCMSCHYRGINPKDDQIRDYVDKNPKAFSKGDAELIRALYVPAKKMRSLMDEDAERFRKALEKTGNKVSAFEPVMTLTLRYEGDVDLATAAAELGMRPDDLRQRVGGTEQGARNLGALKVPGGTVSRQVFVQSFADTVRDFRLGTPFDPNTVAQSLPDNTGEIDPLEAQSSRANAIAFSPDGRHALFASSDKTVRLHDIDAGRDLRRFIGHTASVWCVAFSPDGKRALSGSADATVRLWDVETGREVKRLNGHEALVTTVAFSPDGRRALSGGYDHTVILWDLESGRAVRDWEGQARYVNHVAFSPDEHRALIAAEKSLRLWDLDSGQEVGRFDGHTNSVIAATFSADGKHVLSCGDDLTLRLWDATTRRELKAFSGHTRSVKDVAFSPDGKQVLSAAADGTVRLWDLDSGKELRRFSKHADSVIAAVFTAGGTTTLSGSRDAVVKVWNLAKAAPAPGPRPAPEVTPKPESVALRPLAVASLGGTLGALMLSPDGSTLYYLNASEGKAGRLDAATLKIARELRLADGTELLVLGRDGKQLYAMAPSARQARVQVIDAAKMELARTFTVAVEPYDVAAGDNGLLFLTGAAGDWSEISVVDANKQSVAARWGGVWRRSFVKLTPDATRLYYSSQGVSPGKVEGLVVPKNLDEKPAVYASPEVGKHPLGGDFVISPDGKFLLCKTGTVLRLSTTRDDDLKQAATLEPFVAAAVAPEMGAAFALSQDGVLRGYTYPEFRPLGTYRLAGVGYALACDGKSGRLYVAAVDPKALSERPRGRGTGEVQVYDVKEILKK